MANTKFEPLQELLERRGIKIQQHFEKENAQYTSWDFISVTDPLPALLLPCAAGSNTSYG
jgi:hypothetical protein